MFQAYCLSTILKYLVAIYQLISSVTMFQFLLVTSMIFENDSKVVYCPFYVPYVEKSGGVSFWQIATAEVNAWVMADLQQLHCTYFIKTWQREFLVIRHNFPLQFVPHTVYQLIVILEYVDFWQLGEQFLIYM